MNTTDTTESLLNQLDQAMIAREETLAASRLAQKQDQLAWAKVQAIAEQMDLPKGRTIAGQWIISKGMDAFGSLSGNIEVTRAKILGQNNAMSHERSELAP